MNKLIVFFLIVSGMANAQQIPSSLLENLPFSMAVAEIPISTRRVVSIVQFGGKGDGKTINTKAFATAIDELSAQGGGTLEVPAGVWVTGPIVLKSNVTISTCKETKVIFSTNRDHYPIVEANYEGMPTRRCQANISAMGQENIALIGGGTFDGSGHIWRPVKKNKVSPEMWNDFIASGGVLNESKNMWFPSASSYRGSLIVKIETDVKTESEWKSIKDFLRPIMIDITSCKNVLLDGITITNSPSWTVHPLMCQNVILSNLTVNNPTYGQNTDGLDIESCKNVIVYKTSVSVGDDGICLKSGIDEHGRKRGMPSENIIIDNCTVFNAHGGFVIGSEMSGGVRNIKVTNCYFDGTACGLRFKTNRGRGGIVENIFVDSIRMKDITGDAIIFDLFYGNKGPRDQKPVDITTPSFRNFTIKNITSLNCKRAMYLGGLPEMNLLNVVIENAEFVTDNGGLIEDADGIQLKNISIKMPSNTSLAVENSKNININQISFPGVENPNISFKGNCKSVIIENSPTISKENISAPHSLSSHVVFR